MALDLYNPSRSFHASPLPTINIYCKVERPSSLWCTFVRLTLAGLEKISLFHCDSVFALQDLVHLEFIVIVIHFLVD